MIDMHTHSNCSDGSDDYVTILKKAEELGLKYMSITDHDNCRVYEQMANDDIKKYYSGKLIPGVEMQAYILGFSIELLGYFVDYKVINEEVKKLYKPFEEINKAELERLYSKCKEVGMIFDDDILTKYKDSGYYYATEYLHQEMRKNIYNKQFVPDEESWERESIFFKRHTSNVNSKFYIDESDLVPSVQNVINVIRKAGGYVFIPHIYQYEENADRILDELIKNYDIDGIECYYSTFTGEQIEYLKKYCEEHKKYMSGGSDYHGTNRPYISLGVGKGNLNVDESVILPWVEKIARKSKKNLYI